MESWALCFCVKTEQKQTSCRSLQEPKLSWKLLSSTSFCCGVYRSSPWPSFPTPLGRYLQWVIGLPWGLLGIAALFSNWVTSPGLEKPRHLPGARCGRQDYWRASGGQAFSLWTQSSSVELPHRGATRQEKTSGLCAFSVRQKLV